VSNRQDEPSEKDVANWLFNENRLHTDRTAAFLIANSFLVAAFAILRQQEPEGIGFVPIITALFFIPAHFTNVNRGEKALQVLYQRLRDSISSLWNEIERNSEKSWWLRKPFSLLTLFVGSRVYPGLFFGMWLSLLVFEVIDRL